MDRGECRKVEQNETLTRRKQHLQQRKKTKKKRILSFVTMFMLLFMVGAISVFGYTYLKVIDAFQEMSEVSHSNKANAAEKDNPDTMVIEEDESENPFAVVIIGTDTRSGSGGSLNSDVLMVAFIDPKEKDIHLLSIPRDLKMEIPGYSGHRKANQAFALGETSRRKAERNKEEVTITGPSLVKDMLSEYLEIPIKHYVNVDFKGFKEVVDTVGGVKVNVQRSMVYDDPTDGTHIRLSPGEQILDGENALDYVRFRIDNHGNNASDMDRNMRQQEIIRALLEKLTSFQGATSLGAVLEAGAKNTTTNFSVDQMKDMMWDARSYSKDKIQTIENEAYWDSRQMFTIIPDKQLIEIKKQLKEILKMEKKKF